MAPKSKPANGAPEHPERITERSTTWVLCVADSTVRLHYIGRTLKKAGYAIAMSSSSHDAVAMAVLSTQLQAAVIDEDMVLDDHSVAQSLKAVRPIPILLVCDAGPGGMPPAGVDLVTSNGSRQQILAGLAKLLNDHPLSPKGSMSLSEVGSVPEKMHT